MQMKAKIVKEMIKKGRKIKKAMAMICLSG